MAQFKPNMLPTLIGSLPVLDHDQALRMIVDSTPEIPLWAQLPGHPEEGMMVQFLEGLPGLAREPDRTFIDGAAPGFEEDLLAFYEDYLSASEGQKVLPDSRFALNRKAAPGFFHFVEALGTLSPPPVALKGQITGPVTLATGIKDQDGRALFYDERLRDLIVKIVAMKARYQAEVLADFGYPVMVFIDEPGLAGFGTSEFMSISKQDVQNVLGEVIDAIHVGGALAGVHVCANTDWSLVLDSSADILSFDAYDYFDRLALYQESLTNFIQQERILAWGIVPTSDPSKIKAETPDSLTDKLRSQINRIEGFGIQRDQILAQSLVTPACGTGSLTVDLTRKVLEMTREVSASLRHTA